MNALEKKSPLNRFFLFSFPVVLQHAIRPATAALLAEAHTLQLAQQLVEEGAQVLSLLGLLVQKYKY